MNTNIKKLSVIIFISIIALAISPLTAQVKTVTTEGAGDRHVKVEEIVSGLNHPWGMAFLPDGRALITERNDGTVRILQKDNTLSPPLEGTPETFNKGQGGMLDVALDPNFENNRLVYLSYAQPGESNTASTALGRGRLTKDRIENFEVIFVQKPKVEGPNHFGGRIEFADDGNLFLTLGERFKFEPAQDLSDHLGTVVRIKHDGSIPGDNPFVNDPNSEGEIWSYGHRNIEAAAIDPQTGKLWVVEMGPKGGDELNQAEAGKNYGWPVVSWGNNYDGTKIPEPPTHPKFADAKIHWTPVISPSGMIFYSGEVFPAWKNNAFVGGLTATGLVILRINGENAEEIGRIPLGARIRDVNQGPDGALYVLTDQSDGKLWRLSPSK